MKTNDPLVNCPNIHYNSQPDIPVGFDWIYDKYEGSLAIGPIDGADSGTMPDWTSPEKVPWYGFMNEIKYLEIFDGITNIGDYAFYGCFNLKEIYIPDSVTKIGKFAFSNIKHIEMMQMVNSSLESIGEGAFMNTEFDCDVTLSDALNSIEPNVFSGAKFNGDIIYEGDQKSLINEMNIGSGNSSLLMHSISFNNPHGDCGKTAGDSVKWEVANDTLSISGTGRMADYDAAYNVPWVDWRDDIKKVVVEKNVNSIGKNAFAYHEALEAVDIMGDITEIGRNAFAHCTSLKNIYIPKTVTVMASSNASQNGKYVFNDCTALESIDMDVYNEVFRQYDGGLYDVDMKRLIQYPLGKIQSDFVVPNGIEAITSRAFSGAAHLKTVTIPATVTSIEQWAFDNTDITDIYYEGDAYQWSGVYNYDDKVTALYNSGHIHFTEIPESNRCGSNVYYELIGGTLHINGTGDMYDWDSYFDVPWYFERNYIDDIEISDGVTSIGDFAFYGCTYLGSITVPNSVTSIGDYAFSKCEYLSYFDFPSSLSSIGDYAFWDCTDIRYISLPDTCYSFGESVFRGCTNLMDVSLSSAMDTIPWAMFCDCTSLMDITIPVRVTKIENNAFNGCTALSTITLPAALTDIGNGAFYGCDNLNYVTYGGSYGDRQNNIKTGAKTRQINNANWSYNVSHSLSLVESAEPTCYTFGHTAYYECSHCDKLFEDSEAINEISPEDTRIAKNTHNTALRYAKEATCESEGCIEHYECIYCNSLFADEEAETPLDYWDVYTPIIPHDVEWMQPIGAKCEELGYTAHYECTMCHTFFENPEGTLEAIEDTYIIPATGHDYRETRNAPATCTMDGYMIETCANCGDYRVTEYDALGGEHSFGSWNVRTAQTPATCTRAGLTAMETRICSKCGELEIRGGELIPVTEHSFTAVETPSTCTAMGYTTYTCSACGYSYIGSYSGGYIMHDFTETLYPSTPNARGYTQYTCRSCGYEYTGDFTDYASDASALESAIAEAHYYSKSKFTAEQIQFIIDEAESHRELSETNAPQAEYDYAVGEILTAIYSVDELAAYEPVSIEGDTVSLENESGESASVSFVDSINEYEAQLDVNGDGIVNAKDYAWLIKNC